MLEFFEGREWMKEFESVLRQNNYEKGVKGFVRSATVQGAVLFLFTFSALLLTGQNEVYIIVFSFAAFLAPGTLNYLFQLFVFDLRRKKIEELVPDLLLQASMLPAGTSLEKAIERFSKADYGELSREFRRAHESILSGASPEEALEKMNNSNRSKTLERAVNLIVQGINSGSEASHVFKETAEDILETNSILRERSSSMVVEKYTLLLGGGIIVPLILGLLVGMVHELNFNSLAELGIGLPTEQREAVMQAALLANQLYLVEYAIIASVFVAFQESDSKKALLYAAVLLPLSFIAYHAGQMFGI
ncbi:MAG: type II secretion system F family protein [Candidatus Diapherotrites archaeon]|uniref:Type II secretion system F family protein n=1 Tax=Candidatus Iainarchaeum sp. TaxID=3101447 RepID=A0A7J4IRJ4_9ARCH|nr:MAG: type II secretion system protein F GspF2 [archaeon GW2011_AR10]MBS3059621.1 type II secretion system F family protein [Candidatus Diapherotrites archaeon]HIH08052.1 type II secretion system F family protein [Candidatus Diapherotrites archaeon]